MDVKLIHYILTIAQEGGISRAAGKLYVTQSALDQQLLKLEKELGTPLFCRSPFSLTAAGEVYVEYARRVLTMRNEAYEKIRDISEQQRGTLRLAFVPERGMEMFTEVYPRFYRAYPEVTVVPHELNVRRQVELLQSGDLDVGILAAKEEAFPKLTCTVLRREEFFLIVPREHSLTALAAPPGVPPAVMEMERLRDVSFCLIYRQSTQREILDPIFAQVGITPRVFLETASNRTNVAMVRKGLCCSIVPGYYARELRDAVCFCLPGAPRWSMMAARRRGAYLSKAAKAFIELAKEYFQEEGVPCPGEEEP